MGPLEVKVLLTIINLSLSFIGIEDGAVTKCSFRLFILEIDCALYRSTSDPKFMFGGIQSTLNAKICLFCKIRFLRSATNYHTFLTTNSIPKVLIFRLEMSIYLMSPTRKMFLTRLAFCQRPLGIHGRLDFPHPGKGGAEGALKESLEVYISNKLI